jgi:hypothetical protein
MSGFLIAVDAVKGLDAGVLARVTGAPAAQWQHVVAAPSLARVVASAASQAEATVLVTSLQKAGLTPRIIDADEAAAALEATFEAAFGEVLRDGLSVIRADGKELEVLGSAIRSVTTGRQLVQGQAQTFVVLGLHKDPGAVVFRIPGSELSKLAPGADGADAQLAGVIAAIAGIAPHAQVERGLERGFEREGSFGGLAALGTNDLAHAAVASALIERRFPPAAARRTASVAPASDAALPFHGEDLQLDTAPRAAPKREETEEEILDRKRHTDAAVAALDKRGSEGGSPHAPRPKQPLDRRIFIAGAAAVVLIGVGVAVTSRAPKQARKMLKTGDTWRSPWGVAFTYAGSYDASIADIQNPGFLIDIEHKAGRERLRVPSHEAKQTRQASGARWHISDYDTVTASWIVVEAAKE